MAKSIHTARHEALRQAIIEKRLAAGMTQQQVARKLRRYQSFVATVESGQRRIDVIEFLDFANAIGFKPDPVIRKISLVSET